MARPRSDIADRIVRAASERFLHEGVDGASLRNIASDAETSIGMVYYYFPTKDDLFAAVVERTYAGVAEDLTRCLDPARDVESRIRALFDRLGALSDDELKLIRLIMREALVSSQRMQRVLERMAAGHLPLVAQLMLDAQRDRVLDPRHPLVASALVIVAAGLLPQVLRHRFLSLPFALALPSSLELARSAADLVLYGLLPRPQREELVDRER